jgi:hypothetical protein
MKKTVLMKYLAAVLFSVSIVVLSVASAGGQSLKKEEILSRHRGAIRSEATAANLKSLMALGTSEFESKLPSRKTNGKFLIASQGRDLMFMSSFMSQEYPFEKIGYFAENTSLPYVTAGARSPLGAFLADHEKILGNGLFTGAMSLSWPLLNAATAVNRVETAGSRKIDGRKLYILDYFPRGDVGGELTIKLFFDAENFTHVRTEYRHTIQRKSAKFGELGERSGVTIALTEQFSDFRTVDGVTLPHLYKLDYRTDSVDGTFDYYWTLKMQEFRVNQALDKNFFTFDPVSK